jgi:hypothetical protein
MKNVDELRAELLAEPWGKLAQEAGFDPVDTESSARRAFEFCAGKIEAPVVSISPMKLSDGRTDFYVEIRVGDRIVYPHVFRAEFKAAYHVALYDWLLNRKPAPDLMEFRDDDFPAQAHSVVHGDDDRVKNALEGLMKAVRSRPSETWVRDGQGVAKWEREIMRPALIAATEALEGK